MTNEARHRRFYRPIRVLLTPSQFLRSRDNEGTFSTREAPYHPLLRTVESLDLPAKDVQTMRLRESQSLTWDIPNPVRARGFTGRKRKNKNKNKNPRTIKTKPDCKDTSDRPNVLSQHIRIHLPTRKAGKQSRGPFLPHRSPPPGSFRTPRSPLSGPHPTRAHPHVIPSTDSHSYFGRPRKPSLTM